MNIINKSKICGKCENEYPATSEYFYRQRGGKYGFASRCKKCVAEYDKYYQQSEKGRRYRKKYQQSEKGKMSVLKSHLKLVYGITIEEWNKVFFEQNGCCAICGIHQSELNRQLDIDHNHRTGKIRGLLCNNCNRMIGIAKENKNVLQNAIDYLSHKEN